jgi:hypothetical protein
MPINCYWDKTDAAVMHIDIAGRYTWDEFDVSIAAVAASVARASYSVVVIVDITRAAPMPAESSFQHLEKAMSRVASNVDLCVVNGPVNRFGRTIWSKVMAVHKTLNHKVVFVENVEDAYQVIATRRSQQQSV